MIMSLKSSACKERGVTIIYAVAALLLSVFVGSALLKLSVTEASASGDFGSIASAHTTAESGVLAVNSYLVDNAAQVVVKVNAFLCAGAGQPVDLIGTASSPVVMYGSQKYWARLSGVDKATWTIKVDVVAWGKGGGSKKVTTLFRLENPVLNTPSSTPTHAMYLGGGIGGGATACGIDVFGSTFVRVPFSGSGTAIPSFAAHGPFWLSDSVPPGAAGAATATLNGTRFDGPSYFGRPVNVTGNWGSGAGAFSGKTFFDKDVTISAGNCVPLGGNTWFNASMTGANDNWSNHFHWPSGGTVFGRTGSAYTSGFVKMHNNWDAPVKQAAAYNPNVLGFSPHTDPPEANLVLPAAAQAMAYSGGRVNNASIKGFFNGSDAAHRYNGFVVVNATGWEFSSSGGITGKAIVNFQSFASGGGDGNAACALQTAGNGIVLVIIDIGAGNTGTLDLGGPFNGMIFVKSGNPNIRTNPGSSTSLTGSFYSKSGTQPVIGAFGGGRATFTWNQATVNAIAGLNVFGSGGTGLASFSGGTIRGIRY